MFSKVSEVIVGIVRGYGRLLCQSRHQWTLNGAPKSDLIEIDLKSVVFEIPFIIWKIVIALIIGFPVKSLNQQSPPAIARSEIV